MSQRNSYKPRQLSSAAEDYELSPEQRAQADALGHRLMEEYEDRKRQIYDLLKRHPNDEWLKQQWTPENIENYASGADAPNAVENLRGMSFRQVSYHDLQSAAAQDAKQTFAIYTAMGECVKDHLEGGIFAGDALCLQKPYQRIEFGVVRQGFIDEWQPRGGIEARLVDMLTQTYLAWQFWLEMSIDGARNLDMPSEQITKTRTAYDGGNWQGPRVTQKEWYDHATQMADRFNRMFLRVLRQMRDLRRYIVPVTINNPQQVNIAAEGGQQVNVQRKGKRRIKQKQPAVSGARRLKVAK